MLIIIAPSEFGKSIIFEGSIIIALMELHPLRVFLTVADGEEFLPRGRETAADAARDLPFDPAA